MIPVWPVTLPQKLLIQGYSEAFPDNLLRTSMEMGPAKQRRRGAAGPVPIAGREIFEYDELVIFKTFYNDTLLSGSLRFEWVHPLDETISVEMRFTAVPSWTALSGDLFDVGMALEILP